MPIIRKTTVTPPPSGINHHFLLLLLFLSPLFTAAQDRPSTWDGNQLNSPNVSTSMAVIIVVLVLAFFITGVVSIYIQLCSNSTPSSTTPIAIPASRMAVRGLDPSILNTFPTFSYSEVKDHKIGKGSLECAVCLSEFQEDDTLRLLPKCDHVFHSECIDAWLVGHTTCPVCRANLVLDPNQPVHEVGSNTEPEPNHEVRITINNDVNIKFARSNTTGHSMEDSERYTLRLPMEVRRQLVARAKLKRATSMVVLRRASSSRRGYRSGGGGEGSGSSRYGRVLGRFGLRLGSFRTIAKLGDEGGSNMGSATAARRSEGLPPLAL